MISKTYWLMTGAAVVVALGAGFGAARCPSSEHSAQLAA